MTMELNGIDVEGLKGYVESLRNDPSKADRDPVVVAHWEGGSRSQGTPGFGSRLSKDSCVDGPGKDEEMSC
jgi:hypothetical protein